jgi:hypothetical protein
MAVNLSPERSYQVNTPIIEGMELWLSKDERQRVLWPTVVVLSSRYFETLTNHAVPLDERAIAALSNSPMALDVYAWLAQRLCRIRRGKAQSVPWACLQEQFGFGYSRLRDFKQHFQAVLTEVQAQYLGARFDLTEAGMTLYPSLPPVQGRFLSLPR